MAQQREMASKPWSLMVLGAPASRQRQSLTAEHLAPLCCRAARAFLGRDAVLKVYLSGQVVWLFNGREGKKGRGTGVRRGFQVGSGLNGSCPMSQRLGARDRLFARI